MGLFDIFKSEKKEYGTLHCFDIAATGLADGYSEKTKELIKLKTRQYAKRQFTWARGHMKSWEMIYSPNFNDLYKQALDKIL